MSYAEAPGELCRGAVALEEFFESVHVGNDRWSISPMQHPVSPTDRRPTHNSGMEEKLSDAVQEILGDRLRTAREKGRFTQLQAAEFVGIQGKGKHMSVGHWEAGRNFPSLENLVMVSGLYGVSIDWLVWGGDLAGIDARLRKIPKILRDGLIRHLHSEIDKTEEQVARLPPEMRNEAVKDEDVRLRNWSAKNKRVAAKKSTKRIPKKYDQ